MLKYLCSFGWKFVVHIGYGLNIPETLMGWADECGRCGVFLSKSSSFKDALNRKTNRRIPVTLQVVLFRKSRRIKGVKCFIYVRLERVKFDLILT
jgi:hypothetical protein